ncbi:MAG: TetR family transcriptional regulator [Nocardioides sp.]|uniref:TetR/AcrR family transcriptional regulator n=1 Tax=Nocardioides sp. TaxID=35761 RepID=UPI0039E5BF2F
MARVSAQMRRVQLLDAAERVMARDGVAAGTTRAIAAEAGVPTSVFHYCFRSRDELISELIRRLGAAERAAVSAGLLAEGDLEGLLGAAAEAYLAHLVADPGQEQMLFELNHYALRTPGMAHLAAEQMAMYLESARIVLDQVARAAGVTWTIPVAELARVVVTVTDGVTTTWLADRDTEASRATLARLLRVVTSYAAR